MSKAFLYFQLLLFVCLSGCYVKKSQSALAGQRFAEWIGYWGVHPPVKTKKTLIFRMQVQDGLAAFERLSKTAESDHQIKSAERVRAFAEAYHKAQGIDPGLHSMIRQNPQYNWLPEALAQAPYFPAYIRSKNALAARHYAQAWEHFRNCDRKQEIFQRHEEHLMKVMLADYAKRFDDNKDENNLEAQIKAIDDLSRLVSQQELCLTDQPCPESESGKHKNFAEYFAGIISGTLAYVDRESRSLANQKEFLKAQDLIDRGISVAGKQEKPGLIALKKQIREEGGVYHKALHDSAFENKNYAQARKHNEILVKLGYEDATQQINAAEKRNKADDMLAEAKRSLTSDLYDEAIQKAKQALKLIPGDVDISKFLKEAENKKGWSLVRRAATEAGMGRCKAAYKLVLEAEGLASGQKNDFAGLKAQYKNCAVQRVAVLIQSDDQNFNASIEKYQLLSALQNSLKTSNNEFLEIVNSDNVPVLGNEDNPALVAGSLGANLAVVAAFRGFQKEPSPDQWGKTENYCTAVKRFTGYYDLYRNPIYVYDYKLVPVKIFTDRLSVSISAQGYLLNIETNSKLSQASKIVSDSWQQEHWKVDPVVDYKTVRYCPCGTFISNYTRTNFVDHSNFEKNRAFPAGMALLKDDLRNAATGFGRDFAKYLEEME